MSISKDVLNHVKKESRYSKALKESLKVWRWRLDIVLVLINIDKAVKNFKHLEYNELYKSRALLIKYLQVLGYLLGK